MSPYPFVNKVRGSGDYNINNNNNNAIKKENHVYERYHQQLDNFADKCKPVVDMQDQIGNKIAPVRASPVPPVPASRASHAHKPVIKNPVSNNDFARRKDEYQRNKARGNAHYPVLAKPPMARRDEKSIYEEKLRKIRLQNYNNRRLLMNIDNDPKNGNKQNPFEVDHRLKRMEALKVMIVKKVNKLNCVI